MVESKDEKKNEDVEMLLNSDSRDPNGATLPKLSKDSADYYNESLAALKAKQEDEMRAFV